MIKLSEHFSDFKGEYIWHTIKEGKSGEFRKAQNQVFLSYSP